MKRVLLLLVGVFCGSLGSGGQAFGQAQFIPLTYESTGVVLEIAPDHSEINIDGRIMAVAENVRVHNLVNTGRAVSLNAGSRIGYVVTELSGGNEVVEEIWILSPTDPSTPGL